VRALRRHRAAHLGDHVVAGTLELLGVDRVERLAPQEPHELHAALPSFQPSAWPGARRRPEQVEDWIVQARARPPLVEDEIRPG
jgi:hypothetical protein